MLVKFGSFSRPDIALLIVVRPIKISENSLQDIIRDFSNNNVDLSKRVAVVTGDEVGIFAMGINKFMQILQEIIEKIKCTSVEIQKANETINNGIINKDLYNFI